MNRKYLGRKVVKCGEIGGVEFRDDSMNETMQVLENTRWMARKRLSFLISDRRKR
jgi:hypothetical protein